MTVASLLAVLGTITTAALTFGAFNWSLTPSQKISACCFGLITLAAIWGGQVR